MKCPILPVTGAKTILPQRVYVGGYRILDGVVVMYRIHRRRTYKGPVCFS